MEDTDKENMFYTDEEMMKFRYDALYEREATMENRIVDFIGAKIDGVLQLFSCKGKGETALLEEGNVP